VGLAVSVVFVGFLLVGVFPTRTWLAQRDELGQRQAELEAIRAEESDLEDQIDTLQDPEEIERIAREEYGMVKPGEKPYRMLPAPEEPVDLPETWPFTGAEDWLNR
jgi:cell division protein FtsB